MVTALLRGWWRPAFAEGKGKWIEMKWKKTKVKNKESKGTEKWRKFKENGIKKRDNQIVE